MSKQNMNKPNTGKKDSGLERFLMNVADNAEAALREYWQERDAENRRYATEYVTRRGLLHMHQLNYSSIRILFLI